MRRSAQPELVRPKVGIRAPDPTDKTSLICQGVSFILVNLRHPIWSEFMRITDIPANATISGAALAVPSDVVFYTGSGPERGCPR